MWKKLSVLMLFVMVSSVVMAEKTAHGKLLGRLFYTPSQRNQLEQMENKPEMRVPASSTISVNGVVQRQGKGGVVWINGMPRYDSSVDGLLAESVTAPDSILIRMPGRNQPVRLKVGQTVDVSNGTVNAVSSPASPAAAPSGQGVTDIEKEKGLGEEAVHSGQNPE